jgi:hypothetical protein
MEPVASKKSWVPLLLGRSTLDLFFGAVASLHQFDSVMMIIILSNFSNDSVQLFFEKMSYHIDSLLGFSTI